MSKRYCVVYRMGGPVRCTWKRTVAWTKAEAETKRVEIEQMCYKALVVDYDLSLSIGLPEGWDA